MSTIGKEQLIEDLAGHMALSKKDATNIFEFFFGTKDKHGSLVSALAAGNKIGIPGFGKLETKQRSARTGRNPQTGEEITIEAHSVLKFDPAKRVKELLK